ncbi:MAG: Adenosine monophosphate-protein transferase SoFic [Verrucomicrobia bacterium ADurb.Bin070]|nr:MAG: Adenosine monophosphate-protein transferase SoFic [Verrucomicrobia bacterium ADurb.Bin070]
MRLEYAPDRSPTSFSNGGGFLNGSFSNIARSRSACGFKPEARSFFASFWACLVKTSVHFSDGTGRTGRILNILFLVQKNLLSTPILYLSRAIIRDKAAYYSRLNAITARGEWEPFILYMVNAVRQGKSKLFVNKRLLPLLLAESETWQPFQ